MAAHDEGEPTRDRQLLPSSHGEGMRGWLGIGTVAMGVAVFVALVSASPVAACTSGARIGPGPGEEPQGGVVFTGTAVRVEHPPLATRIYDPALWTFVVDEVRVGDAGKRYTVDTDADSGVACGYPFRLGGRYLVVVPGPGVPPTMTPSNGVERLDELPDPPRVEGEIDASQAVWDMFGIPVLVLAAGLALLMAGRRRRSIRAAASTAPDSR